VVDGARPHAEGAQCPRSIDHSGSTMFPGFADRMQKEHSVLAPSTVAEGKEPSQ